MNKRSLKKSAVALKKEIEKLKGKNHEVEEFSMSISEVLSKAINSEIEEALDLSEVPGKYFFEEGGLNLYEQLSKAYFDFRFEVTGGMTKSRRKILDIIEKAQKGC